MTQKTGIGSGLSLIKRAFMFCQDFRFAGSDLQSTVNHLDIENKGMIRCIQTHCDRFFQRIVAPQVVAALLEANRGIVCDRKIV